MLLLVVALRADEIASKTVEMRNCEDEAEGIDEDPEQVDDVVTVGCLD